MRKQVKALIWASSVTAVATTGIFLGTHFYGKTDSAKGVKIKFVNDEKANFVDYKMQLIDKSTGKEQVVGEYNPDSKTVDGIKSSDWVKQYREKNKGVDPIFRITKGFFKLNNEYVDAVSIDDWFEFAKWYLGYGNTAGHLAYGPESGAISTFEIVPGVNEMSGGGVVLGGRDSSNNEYDKITFYPDSFFGTFSLYDLGGTYFDRLLEPMFPSGEKDANGNPQPMEFTYEEAQDAIKLINKVNKFNGQYLSKADNIDPKVLEYWNNSKWGAKSFTNNGSNTPAPYAIQKSSIKTVNGQAVQYYSLYSELFTRQDGANGGDSLLRKVAKTFPSVLQTVDSPYIELNKSTGIYELKNGIHQEIPFGKRIGLPYILKAVQGEAFKGFGIDFLRYVAIHEYGHHLTLVMAQDNSDGGVTAGGWNGRAAPTATNLYNIDEMNRYFAARSSGIRAVKTDQYNNPVPGWREYIQALLTGELPKDPVKLKAYNDYKEYNTSYFAFAIPTAAANSQPGAANLVIDGYRFEKIDDVSSDQAYSRAFRASMQELATQYVKAAATGDDKLQTTVYNALLQNSFDTMSGTLNPASEEGPFNFAKTKYLTNAGSALMNRMGDIWRLMNREFTSYEQKLVQNILYSTIRGLDADKWPTSERQNLQTYLNFLYKNPEDYTYAQGQGAQMVKDFFNFYDNPRFVDAWFAKGSFRDDYLKTLYLTDATKGLSLRQGGFDPSVQYAYENGRSGLDGDIEHAFYDVNTHAWKNFYEVVVHWQDGAGNDLFSTTKQTQDSRPFTYDADQEFKVWNPYAGYDPALKREFELGVEHTNTDGTKRIENPLYFKSDISTYKSSEVYTEGPHIGQKKGVVITVGTDADGKPITKDASFDTLTDDEKAKAWLILEDKIKHVLNTVAHIMWGTNSAKPDANGRVPFKSDIDGIFSDYTYSFAEVMTRDFVQMTFAEGGDKLKNVDPLIGITSSDTSFEYYIHGDLSAMYATHDENGKILPEHFLTQTDASLWVKPIAQAVRTGDQKLIDSILGTGSDALTASDINLLEKMDGTGTEAGFLVPAYGIEPYNSVFGHDKFLSNGFETDHAYRTTSNWQLYNGDGSARKINNYLLANGQPNPAADKTKPDDNMHIFGPHGDEADTWAKAYWYFILGEYGVGTRSVSTLWRDTSLDKNHMYGYIDKQYADQVHYLRFTNTETHAEAFIPVYTQNTSNLFYLQHQGLDGDSKEGQESRWDLKEEGYVSWTTDKEAMGLYLNSVLTEGSYDVEFVGQNKQEISGLHFNLGTGVNAREHVAENGKFYRTAPTYFERKDDAGTAIFVVKPQFNV